MGKVTGTEEEEEEDEDSAPVSLTKITRRDINGSCKYSTPGCIFMRCSETLLYPLPVPIFKGALFHVDGISSDVMPWHVSVTYI